MKMMVILPRIVQNYIASFPETSQNAYKYFNYDNRVVEKRVYRGDKESIYKGPNQFTNEDYDALLVYARTKINPILTKYSKRVAFEDALNLAIRSYDNGSFDGKINANSFKVLIDSMEQEPSIIDNPGMFAPIIVQGKKEKKEKVIPFSILKNLGINQQKLHSEKEVMNKRVPKGIPHFVRKPGKGVILKDNKKV